MCMRLAGARSIEEIIPEMCCAKDLSTHVVETPHSFLTVDLYEPLKHASKLWDFFEIFNYLENYQNVFFKNNKVIINHFVFTILYLLKL